jgi:hypothetical protein
MSFQSRRELLGRVGMRYREAGGAPKRRMLEEFVASTGYARKYAIRLLVSYQSDRMRMVQDITQELAERLPGKG